MSDKKARRCPCNGDNLERFIQPVILIILSHGSCSGYSVVKQMASYALLQNSPPDPTGIYRQLKQMEEKGSICSIHYPDENGNVKKHYQITSDGLQCLSNWSNTLIDYKNSITQLLLDIDDVIS